MFQLSSAGQRSHVCLVLIAALGLWSSTEAGARDRASTGRVFVGGCSVGLSDSLRDKLITAEGGCKERESGFVWSMPGPVSTYDEAISFCSSYVAGPWGGWEVPSLDDYSRLIDALDAAEGLRLGRLRNELFWARDVLSVVEDRRQVYVTSFMDSEDFDPRPTDEEAAVICVRRSPQAINGCVYDDADAEFESFEGACRHKKSRKTYSPVFEAANHWNARETCERYAKGGRVWRLALEADLNPLIGNRSAVDQIHGMRWGIALWAHDSARTPLFDAPQVARNPSGTFEIPVHRWEQYVFTIDMRSGDRVGKHVFLYEEYVGEFDRSGRRMTQHLARAYEIESRNTGVQKVNIGWVMKPFICVAR